MSSCRYPVNSVVSFDSAAQQFYGTRSNVANAAGGGAGEAVTTWISYVDQYGEGVLPNNYAVVVTPNQAAMASVVDKTIGGFSVILTPPAGVTLGAGTFDLVVMA